MDLASLDSMLTMERCYIKLFMYAECIIFTLSLAIGHVCMDVYDSKQACICVHVCMCLHKWFTFYPYPSDIVNIRAKYMTAFVL